MSKSAESASLDHRAEIYIPSQCKHKQPLPERARVDLLTEAKRLFSGWFGGFQVAHRMGGWMLPDGTLAEEVVDVVISACTREGLEEHEEELKHLAVRIADELDQDAAALAIDGRMAFYQQSDPQALCINKRKAPVPVSQQKPVGRPPKTPVEKMQALYSALDSFSSLDSARHVFSELLGYDLTDDQLPCRDWSKELLAKLVKPPQVICYTRGFKIVHLHLKNERLMRGWAREIVSRILRDSHEAFHGLFVVSNADQKAWELINVKFAEHESNGHVLRRMPVGGGRGVRTATERLGRVSLEERNKIPSLEIQTLHDEAFDVESVTKEFYRRIADWYFWALQRSDVKYPRSVNTDGEKSIFFIRMLTRLIFCWFLREKGLVPQELFDKHVVERLLNTIAPKSGTYYQAFLQNLFFATLNQEIDKRSFSLDNNSKKHGANNYRFSDHLKDPSEVLRLLRQVPFVNGGLFECLDTNAAHPSGASVFLDDFSEQSNVRLCIPNELFFGEEHELNLNKVYGDAKHRRTKVSGLFQILNHYQFTIEENTPLDQAVALDPELLGQVFENLLASYNEETKTTARKALGAFYTPRAIVDYMVDETLMAYFTAQIKANHPHVDNIESRLRHLLHASSESHQFTLQEVATLISAIDKLRILDPAVGSGAFPMGILHKLVFILRNLDPGNKRWKQTQIDRLESVGMKAALEDAFRSNDDDYARKLCLIENCIYGVDIQPIAVQIARMRFFISLIVNQRVDDAARNRGVLALPNLETKFVAANSLIGFLRPDQQLFHSKDIDTVQASLKAVRLRHFTAKTASEKLKCRERDMHLRETLAECLKKDGWQNETAEHIADWDPYDQNASAEFFDAEWMFGIKDGFDIVIGNPPYVRVDDIPQAFRDRYKEQYASATGKYDLYYLFFEKGLSLLNKRGALAYISPNRYCAATSAESLRRYMFATVGSGDIVSTSKIEVFADAANYPIITILKNGNKKTSLSVREAVTLRDLSISSGNTYSLSMDGFNILPGQLIPINISQAKMNLLLRLRSRFKRLGAFVSFSEGLRIPASLECDSKKEHKIVKQYQFERWTTIRHGTWIGAKQLGSVLSCTSDRYKKIVSPKILVAEDALNITATLDNNKCVPQGGVYFGVPRTEEVNITYCLALLNAKLLSFVYEVMFGGMHMGGGYLRYRTNFLEELPFAIAADNSICASVVSLAERLLVEQGTNVTVKAKALDLELNDLIYRIYGLSKDEEALVSHVDGS